MSGRWLACVSIGRDRRMRRRKNLNTTIRRDFRAAENDLNIQFEERGQARETGATSLTPTLLCRVQGLHRRARDLLLHGQETIFRQNHNSCKKPKPVPFC
jgi:hypothetical protein